MRWRGMMKIRTAYNELSQALLITRREVRDQVRDWRITLPLLGLTLFFPFLMNYAAQTLLTYVAQYGAAVVGERLIPFLMMIVGFFPISISLVIALESFVGEKERGTIEPLLNTPLKDWQIYIGKLLAVTLPPLVASFLGMGVYLSGLELKGVKLPEFEIMAQVLALTAAQALMMVSAAVAISSQATTIRAANLLASFVVIPVALLIQAESVIMFWGNSATLWWVLVGLLLLMALLIRVGLSHFQREELLGRQIDVLNLRWGWDLLKQGFTGGAKTPGEWYLRVLPRTLRGLGKPAVVVLALAVVTVWLGAREVDHFQVALEDLGMHDLGTSTHALVGEWPLFAAQPVMQILWQNVRALILGQVLGALSFGILGFLPLLLTMGVTGYLMTLIGNSGMPVGLYLLGFVVPHGVIEIPAAVIATAAILKAGAALATPTPDKTIAEVWITSIAEVMRVMVGVVIPLLIVAAGVEAWVTPRVGLWLFG